MPKLHHEASAVPQHPTQVNVSDLVSKVPTLTKMQGGNQAK